MSFAIYKKPALVKDDSPEEIQKTELALMEWASYAPIKLKFIKFEKEYGMGKKIIGICGIWERVS